MANWAPPCRVLVDCVSEWCAREGVKMRSFSRGWFGAPSLETRAILRDCFWGSLLSHNHEFLVLQGCGYMCMCVFFVLHWEGERERERERFTAAKKVTKAFTKAPQGGSLTCLRHSGSIPPLLFCACTTYHVTDQPAWPLGIPGTHLGSLSTAAWWDPCPG